MTACCTAKAVVNFKVASSDSTWWKSTVGVINMVRRGASAPKQKRDIAVAGRTKHLRLYTMPCYAVIPEHLPGSMLVKWRDCGQNILFPSTDVVKISQGFHSQLWLILSSLFKRRILLRDWHIFVLLPQQWSPQSLQGSSILYLHGDACYGMTACCGTVEGWWPFICPVVVISVFCWGPAPFQSWQAYSWFWTEALSDMATLMYVTAFSTQPAVVDAASSGLQCCFCCCKMGVDKVYSGVKKELLWADPLSLYIVDPSLTLCPVSTFIPPFSWMSELNYSICSKTMNLLYFFLHSCWTKNDLMKIH